MKVICFLISFFFIVLIKTLTKLKQKQKIKQKNKNKIITISTLGINIRIVPTLSINFPQLPETLQREGLLKCCNFKCYSKLSEILDSLGRGMGFWGHTSPQATKFLAHLGIKLPRN